MKMNIESIKRDMEGQNKVVHTPEELTQAKLEVDRLTKKGYRGKVIFHKIACRYEVYVDDKDINSDWGFMEYMYSLDTLITYLQDLEEIYEHELDQSLEGNY